VNVEAINTNKEKISAKTKDSYLDAVCFNCREPGHIRSQCVVALLCFICGLGSHKEGNCPVRKKPLSACMLYGSAETGLEFLHIEILDTEEQDNFSKNVGIVYIEAREIRK
jgi:hypothetical protein